MSDLVNMMEQVRKLKNDVGVQSLIDKAYNILGNPMVFFNTEYDLLAYTEVPSDDAIWNELVTNGTLSPQTQSFFEKEGFIEEVANAAKIAILKSKHLKYDRITGKIFNKNNVCVSNLTIIASNKPFGQNDAMVFEAICKLISREISKNELYQEYEQTHLETVVKHLIGGSCTTKLDTAQVGSIYDSLESSLCVAVVDISPGNPGYTDTAYYRDLFKQLEPAYKYALYNNYIIIIISTNDDVLNVNKKLRRLMVVFEQNNMYAGISSRFENLFELQKYYSEAVEAMQFALETKSSQRIFPYEESSRTKMRQIKELENGEGIQYFLNRGPEIFGNPLLFHDMELNLLAYTENAEIIDPIWEELVTYGTGSDETIELFRVEGWIEIMDNTKAGALLVSDKCKYDRISWRIYNNDNIRIGCTSIVNTDNPFSEDELVLFGAFSRKFSKEVGKIEFYNNYGHVYSETIINRLINGKIDNHTFYSEDVGNLYDNLMDNLYLIVVDMAQCAPEYANLTYFRDLFNWPGTINRYAIHANYIIIIVSTDGPLLNENNEFNEINRVCEKNNIYAGISRCFDNIYEVQKYYIEAVNALNAGSKARRQHSEQRIFPYCAHSRDCD